MDDLPIKHLRALKKRSEDYVRQFDVAPPRDPLNALAMVGLAFADICLGMLLEAEAKAAAPAGKRAPR